jgi:hypothetical protein
MMCSWDNGNPKSLSRLAKQSFGKGLILLDVSFGHGKTPTEHLLDGRGGGMKSKDRSMGRSMCAAFDAPKITTIGYK